jgi:hypothetical protein
MSTTTDGRHILWPADEDLTQQKWMEKKIGEEHIKEEFIAGEDLGVRVNPLGFNLRNNNYAGFPIYLDKTTGEYYRMANDGSTAYDYWGYAYEVTKSGRSTPTLLGGGYNVIAYAGSAAVEIGDLVMCDTAPAVAEDARRNDLIPQLDPIDVTYVIPSGGYTSGAITLPTTGIKTTPDPTVSIITLAGAVSYPTRVVGDQTAPGTGEYGFVEPNILYIGDALAQGDQIIIEGIDLYPLVRIYSVGIALTAAAARTSATQAVKFLVRLVGQT